MVLQLLGDGFNRPGRCLDLLKGFKQPLPPKRPHWRGARCQVTSTIELARAHGQQAAQVRESHASRWAALKFLGDLLKLPRRQETSPTGLTKLGHTCLAIVSRASVEHLMNSILEFGQGAATTAEPRPTAIQDNWLPEIPVQTALNLHWAGNHAYREVVLLFEPEAVSGIEAEQEEISASHLLQAAVLQPASPPL